MGSVHPLDDTTNKGRSSGKPSQGADLESAIKRLCGRYAYIAGLNRYYDTTTSTMLDKAAVDTMHRHELGRGASSTLLEWSAVELVQNVTWVPNGPPFIDGHNGRLLNIYRPGAETSFEGDVAFYEELVEYLVPDAASRAIMIDWLAYQVQHPEGKTNWQILLGGVEGIGKDALFYPLRRAFGPHNVCTLDPPDLESQFNDQYAHRKLVVLNEMESFRNHKSESALKPLAAAPPELLQINPKGTARYAVPNLIAVVAMTNHRAKGMTLSRTDRRWFAYWSPAKPMTPGYYRELWEWLEGDGALHVWHWLLQRDLSRFQPKAPAPTTSYKAELAEISEDPTLVFLRERHEDEGPPFDRDLVLLERVLSHIDDPRIDRGRVGGYLRELGCENRRVQIKDGGKVQSRRVWIVREHERYGTMASRELFDIASTLGTR